MCLAIPMQLVQRAEFEGTAELRGIQRTVSLLLCPEAVVGDHLLIHAGCAIGTIDQEEAEKTIALIDEALVLEELQKEAER